MSLPGTAKSLQYTPENMGVRTARADEQSAFRTLRDMEANGIQQQIQIDSAIGAYMDIINLPKNVLPDAKLKALTDAYRVYEASDTPENAANFLTQVHESIQAASDGIKSGVQVDADVADTVTRLEEVKGYIDSSANGGDNGGSGAGISASSIDLKPQALMDELANSGVKYNPDDVVMVTKTPDGKLLWLETGSDEAGLKHIVDGHATDFANRGINDIPSFLKRTLQKTPVKTGMTKAGPFAEYVIDGKMYKVGYGTNGYIVSFYPIKYKGSMLEF